VAVPRSPPGLAAALAEIQNQPKYQPSDWGYSVLNQETGEVLAAQNADHLFDPGSTMKTCAVSTALRLSGSDYRRSLPVIEMLVIATSVTGGIMLAGPPRRCPSG
jgi:D-alanyl-D-alanine carboxypeptidase